MKLPNVKRQYRWTVRRRLAVLAYVDAHSLKGASRHFGLDRKTIRAWRTRALCVTDRSHLKREDRLVVARPFDDSDSLPGDQTLVVLVARLPGDTQDARDCDGVPGDPKEPQITSRDRRGHICSRVGTLKAS
jgi:hypothetical protein